MNQTIKTLSLNTKALPAEPLYQKILPIIRKRVEDRSATRVLENAPADLTLLLKLDPVLAKECFRLADCAEGIEVAGGDFLGIMYGLGQFLHKSLYRHEGMIPAAWRGTEVPDCDMRFVYFANHFENWYQRCTADEVREQLEDLILWGINGLQTGLPAINLTSWDDPDFPRCKALYVKLLKTAKELGLKLFAGSSFMDFKKPDPTLAADKKYLVSKTGNPICPHKPGAVEYIIKKMSVPMEIWTEVGVDYFLFWPYDEGGCSCDKCWPWGAKGFYDSSRILADYVREKLPNVTIGLSTWYFGRGEYQKDEWDLFYKRLQEDEAAGKAWVQFLLMETRDDVPAQHYPVDHGAPTPHVKMYTFPEPSMTGVTPWGGFGAICTPRLMKRQEGPFMSFCNGGYMYTEGIFDDMNKVVMAGLFWKRDRSTDETLTDYCNYEYKGIDPQDLIRLIELFEDSQDYTNRFDKKPCPLHFSEEAWELARKMDAGADPETRTYWKWRIVYIRAYLDLVRYKNCAAAGWPYEKYVGAGMRTFWGEFLNDDPTACAYMAELIRYYKASEYPDPTLFGHAAVRPPLFNTPDPAKTADDPNFTL